MWARPEPNLTISTVVTGRENFWSGSGDGAWSETEPRRPYGDTATAVHRTNQRHSFCPRFEHNSCGGGLGGTEGSEITTEVPGSCGATTEKVEVGRTDFLDDGADAGQGETGAQFFPRGGEKAVRREV